MAITRSFQPEYMIGMPSVPTETIKEGASQSFKKGEVLVISSGYAIAGTADPTLATILGVSAMDARNVTTYPDVQYTPALPGVVFSGQLNTTLAQTHVGVAYGLTVSSNKWAIDSSESTKERVVIIGLKDPVGTVDGVVYFVFLPNTTIFNATAAD